MDELKPCPFCGGEAYYSYNDGSWYVACFDCGSKAFESMAFGYPPSNMKERRNEAIKRWNKRYFTVNHGKWIRSKPTGYMCSECCAPLIHAPVIDYNYCPNCGSKMEYENGIEA